MVGWVGRLCVMKWCLWLCNDRRYAARTAKRLFWFTSGQMHLMASGGRILKVNLAF